jgi:hypothetical protein
MIDLMDRVVWALAGRKLYETTQGVVCKDTRPVTVVRPGESLHFAKGHQRFGSGGFSADYAVHGASRMVEKGVKSVDNDFISFTTDVVELMPMSVAYWHVGDAIGEGRWKCGIAVCLGEDEQSELEDHFIARILPSIAITELPDIVRYATPRVSAESNARQRAWHKKQHEMETAETERRDRAVRELALRQARRYAGDEATALSIAHLFM